MQRVKRILPFLLALTVALCAFSGCNREEQNPALNGTWYTLRSADAEIAQALLLQINLYEEELALIEEYSLSYCQSVEFRKDQTYSFRYDIASSKPFCRAFFRDVFQQLYEGRSALNELYSRNFTDMNQDAFFNFYAQLYMEEDFDSLLDHFSEDAIVTGGEMLESGTYTLRGGEIICTDTAGRSKAIGYQLEEDGSLLLTYAGGSELYTKDIPTL